MIMCMDAPSWLPGFTLDLERQGDPDLVQSGSCTEYHFSLWQSKEASLHGKELSSARRAGQYDSAISLHMQHAATSSRRESQCEWSERQ